MDDADSEKLQNHIGEIEAEYQKKPTALKEDAYTKVLDELNEDQRENLETSIGPLFDYEENRRVWRRSMVNKMIEK